MAYADDLSLATSPYEQKYMFSAGLINDGAYLSTGDKRGLYAHRSSPLIDCRHGRI